MPRSKIWFHADDYGVTPEQASKILDCHRYGVLNSVSVIPNVNDLRKPLAALDSVDTNQDKIRRILHLNFVEGTPISDVSDVSMLVDNKGFFDKSFVDILKWNYILRGKSRKRLKSQIRCEIAAQLRAVTRGNDYKISGIDSHQHYHMIPIVFDAIMEVISSDEFKNVNIQYIRIPVDPLKPILSTRGMMGSIPKINWVKWLILKLYASRNRKILKDKGISVPVFFGIFFTCEMKYEVVEELLGAYESYVVKKHADLELMFHPGSLSTEYELLDARSSELKEFYMSENRFYEAQCLKSIRTKRGK